jgi:penicillin-binding protein 1A
MPQGEGLPLWRPDNYEDRFYGPSTLRTGVERSRNAMTVRLAQDIGMDRVVDMAERFGVVDSMRPYLAFALGAHETTLERQVTGFSEFVNGGRRVQPYIIERVQDRYGHSLERADTRACESCNMEEWDGRPAPELTDNREQILDPRTAYQIVSILEGVVQRGTGRSLRSLGVPLGGKTGTTNDERDAWFMGVSPDLVVGAYVGFDNPRPMGRAETGGRVAAPVVREFFEHTVATRPPVPFRRPPGIRIVRVNAETGLLAQPGDLNVIEEAFRPGTEPTGERRVIGADGYTSVETDEDELRSGSGGLY